MQDLIELLSNKYNKIVSLNETNTLFKVDSLYNDEVLHKVMYFDFSQEIPESNEELEAYHHKHIAPSYYEIPGSVQWNHYIYFIHDEDEDNQRFYLLQNNKDYARKIVLTRDKFELFLENNIQTFYEQQTELGADLIGQWTNQLERNQLQFVCDRVQRKTRFVETLLTQEIQEVNEENIIEEIIEAPINTNFPDSDSSFINSVNLNDYRNYPKVRNFDFKRVNLIHGVNGTGKTSLLEAIEIVTCGGKTRRSNGEVEPNIDNLILSFSVGDYRVSSNNNIYKDRDKQWYGSTNERGNRLFENFNKFNFYHAEAAHDISKDGNINEIIKSLVLGKDIAWYEQRIIDSKELFSKEKRHLEERKIPELIAREESLKQKIEDTEKQKVGLEKTFKTFKNILNTLNWKKVFPEENKMAEELFLEITNLRSSVDSIYKLSESTKIINLSTVDTLCNLLEINNLELNNSIKSIRIEEENKKVFIRKIENISQKISNLQKLSEWLSIENIYKLLGLETQLITLKEESIMLENAFQTISHYDKYESYLSININIFELDKDLETLFQKESKNQKDLIEKLVNYEEQAGNINTYKSNLQDYTSKILSMSNNKEHCPVCNTKFTEADLAKIVEKITLKIDNIEMIQQLKKAIDIAKHEVQKREQEQFIINELIFLALKFLSNDELVLMSTKDVIHTIYATKNKLSDIKTKIYDLENMKEYFSSKGILEIEFTKFITTYEITYLVDYGPLTKASLEKIKNEYIQELDSQTDSIKVFDENIIIFEAVVNKIKEEQNIFIDDYQNLLQHYTTLLSEVQQLKKHYERIITYIEPQENTVEYLVDNISSLSSVAKQYSELLIQNEKSSIAVLDLEQSKLDVTSELTTLNENFIKLNTAITALESLELADTRLNNFFEENKQSILNTFMLIHAPEEFDDLDFNVEITLRRIGSQEYESVRKISTGQKSALALAIFLTMNRNAKDAPKYILFDDPVSNTDDINILAFFDFLGEIAISGERQIFFATANSKVASLFRKKFDFLGHEFKDIQLSR